MIGKICKKCKESKSLDLFHNDKKGLYGKKSKCRSCISEYDKTRVDKRDSLTWYYKNREDILKRMSLYREDNKDFFTKKEKKYAKNNKDKINLKSKRKRLRLLQAKPKWLNEQQKFEIKKKYRIAKIMTILTGTKYSVDHIDPIYNKNFCGLHVPWNIRIITAQDNSKKGYKKGVL